MRKSTRLNDMMIFLNDKSFFMYKKKRLNRIIAKHCF